jgi:hypothetical protein
LIDQEDYPRAVKQGTQRLGDVARVCRDYATAMRVVVAVVAVAVAVAEVAEIVEIVEVVEVAGAVEREHSNDD